MQKVRNTAALILAAGTSSRMGEGRNKLLLPWQGRPILAHVVAAVLGSRARPVVLVLGHQAAEVRARIETVLSLAEVQVVENTAYALGQSTSVQAGLRALLARCPADELAGLVFVLGDQPMMTSRLIDDLVNLRERSGKRIVAPSYRGQRGNPVLFAPDLIPELLAVSGDEGGRSVLKAHPAEIATLHLDEETPNFDVDTWEAYQKILARDIPPTS